MKTARNILQVFTSRPTLEGAGVHLKRAFGNNEAPLFDPFLMLDDFRSVNPEHFIKGFPWHPHRGIETITYVLSGNVEHGDSMGNQGTISSGDVQWMTAGSGIIHQEMPKGDAGGSMQGFQLWANLPASRKMMDPRYRDIKAEQIPVVELEGGAVVRVICGSAGNSEGPVRDIVTDPEYLDITDEPVRFLLLSGQPIGEPVAWYGPIVMNTQEELRVAFKEYDEGTFIKHRAAA